MSRAPKVPTELQLKLLKRMAEGWALGQSTSFMASAPYWLQRDGVGRGGPTEAVKAGTAQACIDRGWIMRKREDFPTCEWKLTEAGREVANAR